MSMQPPPFATLGGAQVPQPPPRPQQQPVVTANLQFGKVGDGEGLAVAFLFTTADGVELPPIILTNDLGVLRPELADIFSKMIADVSPPEEPAPEVRCSGCGTRIFGEVAERGRCGTCEKADQAPGG